MENGMNRLYKIGEVSDYFHLSVQTLRLYEKNGLFVPSVINEETGYRYYEYTQFERLRMIVFLKDLGLPLKTIKNLVDMPKGEEYVRVLESYRTMLEQQIREDIAKKNYLDEKIHNLRISSRLPQNQVLFLHFPELRVVRYDKPIDNGTDHELALLDFMNVCQLSPGVSRIGQLFDPDHLVQQDLIVSNSMFVREEMCNRIPPEKAESIYHDVFPEGIYAALYYQKPTEGTLPFVYELLDEVRRHSFTPIGNIIRSIVFDVGSSEYAESGYLACIRILVKPL